MAGFFLALLWAAVVPLPGLSDGKTEEWFNYYVYSRKGVFEIFRKKQGIRFPECPAI